MRTPEEQKQIDEMEMIAKTIWSDARVRLSTGGDGTPFVEVYRKLGPGVDDKWLCWARLDHPYALRAIRRALLELVKGGPT